MKTTRLILALLCAATVSVGTGILLSAVTLTAAAVPVAHAAGVRFVATTGIDAGDCTDSAHPCATVQYAVDMANTGDEIRVAGGVYNDVHVRPRNDVTLTGVVTQVLYLSKTVTIQGGFTLTNWVTANPTVFPSILNSNYSGRVLYITGGISPTVIGLVIERGNAAGQGGYPSYGGSNHDAGAGIYVNGATVILSGTVIGLNGNDSTTYAGGGVYVRDGKIMLVDNVIGKNLSGNAGGGVYLDGGEGLVIHNLFVGNSSQSVGGALFSQAISTSISYNHLESNRAGDGGALALSGGGAYLEGNFIYDNQSDSGRGSALWLYACPATVVNTAIIENYSNVMGSAVYVLYLNPRFIHTTIAYNRDQYDRGTGIFLDNPGSVSMTNTILVGQQNGIVASYNGQALVDGVLWFDNQTNAYASFGGTITVTNAYTGSPAFLPDGYHLSAVSAAIDRGVDAAVTGDIDGDPRPFGPAPDLGADEYVGPPPKSTYLPGVFR